MRVGMETQNGNDKIGTYPDSAFMLRSNLKVKLKHLMAQLRPSKEVVKIDKVITINVLKNVMKYDKEVITAKAGTPLRLF